MLIAIRTCPYQRWRNLDEQAMLVFNLALQNVSLSRQRMEDHFDAMVQKNTLSDLRSSLESNSELHSSYQKSMKVPIKAVSDQFRSMKLKDEPISINSPASNDDITDMVEYVRFIDPAISKDLSADTFNNASALKEFVDSHCHSSIYAFQVKKCLNASCYYCSERPVVMDKELFSSISFLPLPILDNKKEHFSTFSEVMVGPAQLGFFF